MSNVLHDVAVMGATAQENMVFPTGTGRRCGMLSPMRSRLAASGMRRYFGAIPSPSTSRHGVRSYEGWVWTEIELWKLLVGMVRCLMRTYRRRPPNFR
jgi:hypothetical protein